MEAPNRPRPNPSSTRSVDGRPAPLATASGRAVGGGRVAAAAAADDDPAGSTVVPPYWQRHRRHVSSISIDPSRPSPIRLEDHTVEGSEQAKALWAKHVSIDDYVIVSGNAPGVGAYVVWSCTVETLDVSILPGCFS
jgi:hypothetical protein